MNYITQCANGWCGQLNNILQYIVEPDSLISLASTNKAMLVYVQRFFQRIQNPSFSLMNIFEQLEHEDILSNYWIWFEYSNGTHYPIILKPVSVYKKRDIYSIYGWVLWDEERNHEKHGRYPAWVRLEENYCYYNSRLKIIPYR